MNHVHEHLREKRPTSEKSRPRTFTGKAARAGKITPADLYEEGGQTRKDHARGPLQKGRPEPERAPPRTFTGRAARAGDDAGEPLRQRAATAGKTTPAKLYSQGGPGRKGRRGELF